jgi:hypothetical protein
MARWQAKLAGLGLNLNDICSAAQQYSGHLDRVAALDRSAEIAEVHLRPFFTVIEIANFIHFATIIGGRWVAFTSAAARRLAARVTR